MEYPILKAKQKSRQMLDTFLGYNHNLRIGENEFCEMQNMTSDDYPVLSPRPGRGTHIGYASAMIAKDTLCYVSGTDFVIGHERIPMALNDKPKQLVSMGSYVIIFPDKKWINTIPSEWDQYDTGYIDVENTFNEKDVTVRLCDPEGNYYETVEFQERAADGVVWVDVSVDPPVLRKYSGQQKVWTTIPSYMKISVDGIGYNLQKGDGVELYFQDSAFSHLNGYKVLQECESGYIVVDGAPSSKYADHTTTTQQVRVSRKIPDMDFIIESNNRLWGCKYGYDDQGKFLNEIYASKLGDFKNWRCYRGISTDSYTASCGTDGPFTGAIAHMGYPIFFKENCMHKVYGDYPANFRIQSTECRGVQKGSHNSLAIVNETLFYKSRDAVCAYDGSMPVEVSSALGNVPYCCAVACGHGSKYYINMGSIEDGASHLFVFDTAKGVWHKEDNIEISQMCSLDGEIYAITSEEYANSLVPNTGTNIVTMLGNTGTIEKVEWMVESGKIGMEQPDMKYLTKLQIRMSLAIGSEIRVSIRYDSVGDWEQVFVVAGTTLRSFVMPVRPRRCDHFHIRIEGKGQGKIYSIAKTIERGSDVS
jgi:hypothetical protein